ncbi:molecular chaperone [Pseudomonas carnis]|uniref:fimbrial biogenesis chaperone n=1 Tax=Pseudomonas carnis TaxID=2487355 RepID=UPI0018E5E13D|nr:molecular chaperone [Pseudomonas carnis]MBI6656546.1 molecular chaperone [Pseudomonas carnis]MBI6663240.1 molecular chaperone [Pseudomonas carnis]MBI6686763.1 molecular chaperone [Pseudomonas carnis]
MSSALWRGGLGVLMSLQAIAVQGEIVIDRTRVIYPVTARTVVVNLHNEADGPRLVQAWIDDGDAMAAPENSDVPFTITPPIARMNAGTGRALRIMHDQTPKQVADRESVYWLNVLAIRPSVEASDETNALQFAFRTRIKLFLRPAELPGQVQDVVHALQWCLSRGDAAGLEVLNPAAYHVTLSGVVLTLGGVEHHSEDPPMVAPYATARVALPELPSGDLSGPQLQFTTLDDDGATQHHQAQLQFVDCSSVKPYAAAPDA